jgi:hypothetical protein
MNAQWALFQKVASTSLTLIHASVAAPALVLARTTPSSRTKIKNNALKRKKPVFHRLFHFFCAKIQVWQNI